MWNFLNVNFAEYWSAIDTTVNSIVTTTTFISALYVVVVMAYWWWRLKLSTTNLRPLIFSIAVAKLGILLWAASNIIGIVIYGGIQQPAITLPSRIIIMCAILIQVWVTTKVKPAPHLLYLESKNKD